jgi:TrmH family RNA methyltransferase
MITSADNQQLKTIRKLQRKSERARTGLFVAEGEDLVAAAEEAGWRPELLLRAEVDVDPELLAKASSLGSGTRVVGVYPQRWSEPGGANVSVYLHGVADPGNVGAVIRTAHALCDGPVVLGPGCADPFSPKAVRASMGSIFARPPALAGFEQLTGTLVALDPRAGESVRDLDVAPPLVVCLGAEREGLPVDLAGTAVGIPVREHGPESLNVAAAAAIALWEVENRMAGHG